MAAGAGTHLDVGLLVVRHGDPRTSDLLPRLTLKCKPAQKAMMSAEMWDHGSLQQDSGPLNGKLSKVRPTCRLLRFIGMAELVTLRSTEGQRLLAECTGNSSGNVARGALVRAWRR